VIDILGLFEPNTPVAPGLGGTPCKLLSDLDLISESVCLLLPIADVSFTDTLNINPDLFDSLVVFKGIFKGWPRDVLIVYKKTYGVFNLMEKVFLMNDIHS